MVTAIRRKIPRKATGFLAKIFDIYFNHETPTRDQGLGVKSGTHVPCEGVGR